MTWVPYLFIGFLGLGVLFHERRINRLERGRHLDRIRIDNVVACSRHHQRAGEIMADALGDVRRKLAEHAVELDMNTGDIREMETQVAKYVIGKTPANPWKNRGGLN